MFGEAQIYNRYRYLVFVHLIALITAGCGSDAVSSARAPADAGVSIDGGPNGNSDFQLISFIGLPPTLSSRVPTVLIEARDEVTGHIRVSTAPAIAESFALDLSGLSLPVTLRAFIDINETQRIERCPTPARSGQVITDAKYDLWSAESRLSRPEPQPFELNFERALCGPGTQTTSWAGVLDLSKAPGGEGSELLVHLKSIHDDGNATFETTLKVASFDPTSTEPPSIRIDGLLPGRHELRLFWDDDHDLTYSPCIAEEIGGGDLGFSDLITFEIMEGETLQAVTAIALHPSTCPDMSTTLTGSIDFSALTNESPRKLDGNLLVEVTTAAQSEPHYVREVSQENLINPSFTITNLPATEFDLSVYIDRNGDQRLFSCAADPDGQDLYSSLPVSFSLTPSADLDLGFLQLEPHDCALDRLSNISQAFTIDAAGDRKESPRPVYVSIADEDTGEVSLLMLSESHLQTVQPFELRKVLAPGNYNLFAFVDTEEDGVFSHCEFDAFGDRARSELFRFQLSEYELFQAPPLAINRLGCDFPTVQFNLNVEMELVPLAISQMKIVINLKESGGLTETLVFEVPPVEPPWFFPVSDLVPGAYKVTVHLDQNGDRLLNECSEEELREVVGFQDFVLDRDRPLLDTSIELVDPCVNMESTNED
jgi:uncharacterized protein (DUF2141 family)